MKRIFIPIILLVLTLNVSACGGLGGSLLSAALGGNSMGADGYGTDVGDYDYEGSEDLDSEEDESTGDTDVFAVDSDETFTSETDEITIDETADEVTESVAEVDEVTETDDAASTEGVVGQDGGVGNAATDESEVPTSDDLIDSGSTGPVALPVTPPREGEECSVDISDDSEGATMAISYIPDDAETNSFSRPMKGGLMKGNKLSAVSAIRNSIRNNDYEGEAFTCMLDEGSGKYTWQRFSPSNAKLGLAVLYGEGDDDAPTSKIYLGDLKVTGTGKFKFSGKKLPKVATSVEFKFYDKLTGLILE